uniref:Uncharacterized protein n=1 Tax=Lates calcarifer TaxID=8187 RepID=A0A4W6F1E6_LATCA
MESTLVKIQICGLLKTRNADKSNVIFIRVLTAHLDSSAPAFADSIGHSSTRRVNHGHEANEAQLLSGEVHFISVKSKALWELVVRQVEVAETWMERDEMELKMRRLWL